MSREQSERWYKSDPGNEGDLAGAVFNWVEEKEREQTDLYTRFYRLNCLYDPHYRTSYFSEPAESQDRRVSENLIARGIDTVVGIVAASEVRPRVLLDDGDWAAHRRASSLSWYSEGLGKQIGAHQMAVEGFRDAALKGTGMVKVTTDWEAGAIYCERIPIEDIIVSDYECRGGRKPRQLHHRDFVERDELIRRWPEHEEELEVTNGRHGNSVSWAGYRPIEEDQLVIIESWYLPYGKKGTKGYKPGRHVVCVDDLVLLDEEYHVAYFPFARMAWTERVGGWYAIGAGERMAGHQRRSNKLNWQVDTQQDRLSCPVTYVSPADANMAVKTTSRLGAIAVVKGGPPTTVIAPAVSGETYARLEKVNDSALEELGLTAAAVSGALPGKRMDSGAAIREQRNVTTQRFAMQEQAFERFVLDIHLLALDCARELALKKGYNAPVVIKRLSKGRKKLIWKDVDLEAARIQMQAAATLSRTPAGRTQTAMEWAQAGIISQDEARKLMQPFNPLDLDSTISLYTTKLDDLDLTIEQLLDGDNLVPEPFQDLKLGVWRVQQAYLKARGDGAPEEILENLRQWAVQGAYVLATQAEQAAMQQMAAAAPQSTTPVTAMAPEAKQIAGIG